MGGCVSKESVIMMSEDGRVGGWVRAWCVEGGRVVAGLIYEWFILVWLEMGCMFTYCVCVCSSGVFV